MYLQSLDELHDWDGQSPPTQKHQLGKPVPKLQSVIGKVNRDLKYFRDRFQAELHLWIICVFCFLCFLCFRVCSLLPCGHLMEKDWPLGSCCWCLLYFCYFPMWYPGSGVVLDCIVSWSLPSFLLKQEKKLSLSLRAAKVQTSLPLSAVSSELWRLAYTRHWCCWKLRLKSRPVTTIS